jgi:hypothetical protein
MEDVERKRLIIRPRAATVFVPAAEIFQPAR